MHHRHWRRARRHLQNEWAACGPDITSEQRERDASPRGYESMFSRRREEESAFGASGLGTRRPLRFLAHRLDLTRDQVNEASRILERLKIEREQAAVDLRRAAADIADAFGAEHFDAALTQTATEKRVEAARAVQASVAVALRELHQLLDDEQRSQLATLIRTRAIRL